MKAHKKTYEHMAGPLHLATHDGVHSSAHRAGSSQRPAKAALRDGCVAVQVADGSRAAARQRPGGCLQNRCIKPLDHTQAASARPCGYINCMQTSQAAVPSGLKLHSHI